MNTCALAPVPSRSDIIEILQTHLPNPISKSATLRIESSTITGDWNANLIDVVGEQSITFFSNGSMAVYVGKII